MTKYGDADDGVVRQTTFETTCVSGTFDPPVIPVKRGTAVTISEHSNIAYPFVIKISKEDGFLEKGSIFQPIRSEKTVLSRFWLVEI